MSVQSASIRDYTVVNEKAVRVTAVINLVNQQPLESVSSTEIREALGAATGHKMQAIPDTFIARDKGKDRMVVTGFMGLSSGVISIPENKTVEEVTGFQSFSSNMFLDDEENLWELSAVGGRNLIRSHAANSAHELEQLMASFSSATSFASMSNYENKATAQANADQASVIGGDLITFMCSESGYLDSALVVASVDDDSLLCVSSAGAFTLDRKEVVSAAAGVVANSNMVHPEMVSVSSIGQTDVTKLTDYYTKLFSHNQEYLNKILAMIKQHACA